MGLSLSLSFFTFIYLLLSLLFYHSTVALFISSNKSLCHKKERSTLLQFKKSLFITENSSSFYLGDSCNPKFTSWNSEGNVDCCSWDGVECNEKTGHVIKLDLADSCLYGSINSSNSLFDLVHLEWLNLASNHFNFSEIPSAILNFSKLTYLNLSSSSFSGQIPSEILHLSNLVSLDLSRNSDFYIFRLQNLLEKLRNLKHLDLGGVTVASLIPHNLANLSTSLTFLSLHDCQLQGKIPSSLGNLTKLVHLDLSDNELSDKLPASLENLASLQELHLSSNNFSSELPTFIGNLASLENLDLSSNGFSGNIPPSLGNLTHLHFLDLSFNKFSGELPASIGNIKSLEKLDISDCNLSGEIPSSLGYLTQLSSLVLSRNNFNGTMDLDLFLARLKNLEIFSLSSNKISLVTKASVNTTSFQKFYIVELRSCNIVEFPSFLKHQHHLWMLDLSSNKIQGKIPRWWLNTSIQSLSYLNLSYNFLTGFDGQHPIVLSGNKVPLILDLGSNNFQGPLPVPPPLTLNYLVANNSLMGEIPTWICKLNSLKALDLSHNNLSGELPECLGNFSNQLSMLQLGSNKFSGSIPQIWNGSFLRMIDLSNNLLRGRIPRSLTNCRKLEFLNLGNNQISDHFPSWLGTLPDLIVLILHANRLHGTLRKTEAGCEFPKLRIIDLSANRFTGKLPSKYFECWNAMKIVNTSQLTYMRDAGPSFSVRFDTALGYCYYSLTMSNKGIVVAYGKISNILVAIIFSQNKFDGEIPASIADLRELQILDLSNNNFQGHISSFLSNLTNLESLDLSNNKLSGQIPQKLVELTFLEFFNVSHNNLTGLIPQGNQFTIFDNSSFDGNSGLCGKPLSKKCENETAGRDENEDNPGSESPFPFVWITGLIGYSSGLIVGVILGLNFSTGIQEWFEEKFGKQSKRIRRRRRRRN